MADPLIRAHTARADLIAMPLIRAAGAGAWKRRKLEFGPSSSSGICISLRQIPLADKSSSPRLKSARLLSDLV